MKERKQIAVLSESYDLLKHNERNSIQLILRVFELCFDIVFIRRDTPIDEDMDYIIIPSNTEEKVYATQYFKVNYSELFHYSIFESGALRIELLERRNDEPFDCLLREYEPSMDERSPKNMAEFMTYLLSESLPDDCTRLCVIDYISCFPNDEEELDLSAEPQYKESYFDAKGNVIQEKYGRKRKSDRDDYIFYDGDERVMIEVRCWLNIISPHVEIVEYNYNLDVRRRITNTSSVSTYLPSGEKKGFHWQNRWKKNGRLVHCKCDDATKEMISFRPDGKEKHSIYIPNPHDSGSVWKWESYYKYDQFGTLISRKTKCYKKKASGGSGENCIEISYTYYGEDGRGISGKHDQLKGTYLNDEHGNWIQYIERSPNGNITDLIIRSIHYGKGDYFIDMEHNLIHKKT